MRLAVTGATGRLGINVVHAAEAVSPTSWDVLPWTRAVLDLDRPDSIPALVEADRPDVVVHAAAWTDVDGCANEPELALRRNGEATAVLAKACAAAGADLLYVSTNEVFDGERTDGRGYGPGDPVGPINAYGRSKFAGELGAAEAYGSIGGGARLTIVRTAWLFGPPGLDFPARIISAAARARDRREPLRVVADEVGSPTYALDLGAAIVAHLQDPRRVGGTYHVVNAGRASRSAWAREVLRLAGLDDLEIVDIASAEWPRSSRPPRWAVLANSDDFGPPLRDWRDALGSSIGVAAR